MAMGFGMSLKVLSLLVAGPSAMAQEKTIVPDLKALMPLAKSPISPEILPLPPNRSATTMIKISQCQMLKLPIGSFFLR